MLANKVCLDCGGSKGFSKIEILEKVKVKDIEIENTHLYFKCECCDELFEPFDNPDVNLLSDYRLFRERKNLLQPEEMLNIRLKYKLSQRDLAKLFGMGYPTISNLENGSLQNDQQNALYLMSNIPEAMCGLLKSKKDLFSEEKYSELMDNAKELCNIEYRKLMNKQSKLHDDINHLTRRINLVEYEVNKNVEPNKVEKEKIRWALPNFSIKKPN